MHFVSGKKIYRKELNIYLISISKAVFNYSNEGHESIASSQSNKILSFKNFQNQVNFDFIITGTVT